MARDSWARDGSARDGSARGDLPAPDVATAGAGAADDAPAYLVDAGEANTGETGTGEAGTGEAGTGEAGERNEWLELFFDLVVVAAIAVLSDGLRHDPSFLGLGLFALLYGGIWLGWVTVVLYANIARQRTRTRTVMVAMALVAIMAATAPSQFESRANAFAVAFLLLRVVATRASLGTGRLLRSWPLLQLGGASLPWLVAMWVDVPWKYALWGTGLVLDLGGVLLSRGTVSAKDVATFNERLAEQRERERRKARRRADRSEVRDTAIVTRRPEDAEQVQSSRADRETPSSADRPGPAEVVDVETAHLTERLGLFVIIVLGEAVSALVLTAASHEWTRSFVAVALAGFALLVGLWWLTFSYGFVGAPHARVARMQPRFALPMHLLTTIGIVALAAGVGEMAAEPEHPLHGILRWVMCGGLSLVYLLMGVAGWTGGAPRSWLLGWVLPCVAAPLVVGAFADALGNWRVTWCFVVTILWVATYPRMAGDRPGRGRSGRRGRHGTSRLAAQSR